MSDQVLQMLNFHQLEVVLDLIPCFALVHLNLLPELLFGQPVFLNSLIAFHLDHALAFYLPLLVDLPLTLGHLLNLLIVFLFLYRI